MDIDAYSSRNIPFGDYVAFKFVLLIGKTNESYEIQLYLIIFVTTSFFFKEWIKNITCKTSRVHVPKVRLHKLNGDKFGRIKWATYFFK
jgi:hypothetical protein